MEKASLLIEIGVEELPPVRLDKLGQSWLDLFLEELNKLEIEVGAGQFFIAPRRMALLIKEVPAQQADRQNQRKGPALQAAFDKQGNPTPAAQGFARSCGTQVSDLKTLETPQGSWLVFDQHVPGLSLEQFAPLAVQASLEKLPIAKRMRWGSYDEAFVRPVHWCVALHGSEVVPFEIFSLQTSQKSRGHRVHHPEPIYIAQADDYADCMREGYVLADYDERKAFIADKAKALAKAEDAHLKMDDSLLDIVTGLNEWPQPMIAQFDSGFLNVPQEALITSMEHHQKCFALLDQDNKLLPKFVLVANTQAQDPKLIIHGNERVMHARLSDAQFFYHQDQKNRLDSHLDGLKNMIFQKKLGTLYEKTKRVTKLAGAIALRLEGDASLAQRTAQLSKCDLLTEMVGEFPELQGIMGMYYALNDGEHQDVALGIREAYLPRFSGDTLPTSLTGLSVALADRLDTLVGIFGIGKAPTGDKDPFGLRRSALAVLRILIEKSFDLDLEELLVLANKGYRNSLSDEVIPQVLNFCFERFKAWSQDKGISPKVIEAVSVTRQATKPLDFSRRVEAVNQFQQLPQAQALAAANKRVRNILTKSGFTIDFYNSPQVDEKLLVEPAECQLYQNLVTLKKETQPLLSNKDYSGMLSHLAQLRDPVDHFFDEVMVNVEDESIRQNRINLLSNLQNLFAQIADISQL